MTSPHGLHSQGFSLVSPSVSLEGAIIPVGYPTFSTLKGILCSGISFMYLKTLIASDNIWWLSHIPYIHKASLQWIFFHTFKIFDDTWGIFHIFYVHRVPLQCEFFHVFGNLDDNWKFYPADIQSSSLCEFSGGSVRHFNTGRLYHIVYIDKFLCSVSSGMHWEITLLCCLHS